MRALLLLLAVLLAPATARAVESDAVESPRARVTLAAENTAVAPGQPFRLALRMVLAPGWHSYWTNPGDAGEAPALDLALPDGGAAGPLALPAPTRIPAGPLMSFGYTGEALFPLTVTPPASLQPGRLYTIEGTARWLVCAEICIPEEGDFRLDLPVEATPRPDPGAAPLFRAAEAALPRPLPFAARAGFEGRRGALEITGPGLAPGAVKEAFFFPEAPGAIESAAPQPLSLRDSALTLSLARGPLPLPDHLSGVVAITDAAGVRGAYTLSVAPGPMPAAPAGLPLWQAVLLAALGGLILNLMPCVFPILAMKAMALARHAGAGRTALRAESLAYAAGVVLAFLLLGGALVALRAAGIAAGWGFQFTAPAFVAAMAWLMLAVGLNLSGVYAVAGPALSGGRGSFATGLLAVAVATPCTAPFMAAALGAALAMPPAAALAVFAALGIGMAAPQLLIALAPNLALGLARLLPRPGAWMERLRQALAFPMYAAAAWLAWVVSVQAGPEGLGWVLAGAVLVAFAAWALGATPAGRARWIGRGAAGLAMAAALATLPALSGTAPAPRTEVSGEAWSARRLAELRAEGRPVFVNLTAAWCITCRVNERVALETEATRDAFARAGIAVLTGDWTRGDSAITALLREQGREGVPLYLLYPPGDGAPVVLPQILTERMVGEAVAALPRPPARPLALPLARPDDARTGSAMLRQPPPLAER
ncbi:protein-disulfide reductase DsbD family protein [Pararoseomonas indoligenes]|uniref:Thioredoxin family protein n=1 Tax=Roseomonas indoligenes TaxID=2820811 RepID=A0A940N2M1_9PROT|nr:protein-disulfide reductase DsbD domain-containing protein [Pararoseomonas indoligenes]MBP0494896.1 thioredoxin family protein [Pararoseomonas indoligenes]